MQHSILNQGYRLLAHGLGLAFFSVPATLAQPPEPDLGVIVELVDQVTQRGLQPGDRLLSWRREEVQGEFRDISDWLTFKALHLPQPGTDLWISRADRVFQVSLEPGVMIEVRPRLPSGHAEYENALHLMREGRADRAAPELRNLLVREDWMAEPRLQWWLRLKIASLWRRAGTTEHAQRSAELAYEQALVASNLLNKPITNIETLEAYADLHANAKRFPDAEKLLETAEHLAYDAWGENLAYARLLLRHARLQARRLQSPEAASDSSKDPRMNGLELTARALAVAEEEGPQSSIRVELMRFRGGLLYGLNQDDAARELWEQALQIAEIIFPNGAEAGKLLNNLGGVERSQGRLRQAEDYLGKALSIKRTRLQIMEGLLGENGQAEQASTQQTNLKEERLALRKSVVFTSANLGMVKLQRGNLLEAETLLTRDLSLIADPRQKAKVQQQLGNIANHRMDLAQARTHYAAALNDLGPANEKAPEYAAALDNLATVEKQQALFYGRESDFESAKESFKKAYKYSDAALKLAEGFEPTGKNHNLARFLTNRGLIEHADGHLERAIFSHKKAEEILRGPAQPTFLLGFVLHNIGDAASDLELFEKAKVYYLESLSIRREHARFTFDIAKTLHGLGTLFQNTGKLDTAAGYFEEGTGALGKQLRRLGGDRNLFLAKYGYLYHDYVDLLLQQGKIKEAVGVLSQLKNEEQLARISSHKKEPEENARLMEIDQEISRKIGAQSPKVAALLYPVAPSADQVLNSVDQEVTILFYSLGPRRSNLFVFASSSSVEAIPINASKAEIHRLVKNFRRAIIEAASESHRDIGQKLYGLLIAPAEDKISEKCTRLVIIPDGPLRTLPFAALSRPATSSTEEEYLVEWKSLRVLHSLNSIVESAQSSRSRLEISDAVFLDDPDYDRAKRGKPAKDSSKEFSVAFERYTDLDRFIPERGEILQTTENLPGRRVLRQGQATEANFRTTSAQANLLYLSGHAILDDVRPLESGFLLSVPERECTAANDGFLQVREILEEVNLQAGLVVLDLRWKGDKVDIPIEGLWGLHQALEFAGSRYIVSPLWDPPDAATAALFTSLYSYLRSGLPADVALQEAQRRLLEDSQNQKSTSANRLGKGHPRSWAAFQLYGG